MSSSPLWEESRANLPIHLDPLASVEPVPSRLGSITSQDDGNPGITGMIPLQDQEKGRGWVGGG